MFIDIFSSSLTALIEKLNYRDLTEIRIRVDKPILLYFGNMAYFLSENGLTSNIDKAICATKQEVEDMVFRASNCSIYAVNERIKKGYIVLSDGTRIGLCGDVILESESVSTITNFSSLNIRIAHQVRNCSLNIYHLIASGNEVKNTLIISPPGAGKTTLLRDLILQLSVHNVALNVTVLDERGEIAGEGLDLGNYSDIITFAPKNIGFEQAIRTMSPALIATDELANESDAKALINAFNCGTKIFATIHGSSIEEVKNKAFMQEIIRQAYFERYVILSSKEKPGTIEGVYNQKFSRIGFVGGI